MKKTLLTLLCALSALGGQAQNDATLAPPVPLTQLGAALGEKTNGVAEKTSGRPLLPAQRSSKIRRAAEAITEQPAGTLHDGLTRTSLSQTTSLGTTTDNVRFDGKVCKWVEGDDGSVYIYDPVVAYHTGAWAKGEWGGRGASGDTIYVTGPQLALQEDYYGYFTYYYYADRMEQKSGTWAAASSNHKTMFIWRNDSLIQPQQNNVGYGYVNESGKTYGLMDHYSTAKPMTDKLVEPPAKLLSSARDMAMRSCYSYVDTTWNCRIVKMIVDDENQAIYLQNISDVCPDAWIKGKIEGTKVTFDKGQYLGIYEDQQYYSYLSGVTTKLTWWEAGQQYYYYYDLADKLTFTYDPSTGSLSNDDGGFAVVPGSGTKYFISYCLHPHIMPITGEAAAPTAPVFVTSYAYQFGEWSAGSMAPFLSLQFHLPSFSDEGKYLDPSKMSYVIYLDTMRYELQPDEYSTLTEAMTEVPYDFTDNYYFYKSGMSRAFYLFEDCDSLGIQSIYTDGEVKHYSPITYFTMSEGTAYSGTKASSYYDGEKLAWGTTPTGKRETFDVAKFLGSTADVGQQVEGIRVRLGDVQATIVKAWAAKIVKSEENGDLTLERLADALTVAETDETTGEITFTFTQPVTVPAEGLYVGYSFRIDDPTGDNISPVSLLKNKADGGFWCHTTRSYRHWRDLSYYGALDVDILLGNVSANAAKIGTISSTPVALGSEPQITFSLINVGNGGVQTFGYSYEVGGNTYEDTYDLGNKPVGSTLGDSANVTLTLPASLFTAGGAYPLTLNVTHINGDVNSVAAQATTELLIYATIPHHRSVEEEYTGTWCGWCPRGLKALEMMNERHPDEFIAISYHNGSDPMAIDVEYPNSVSGFPKAWVDRVVEADPYYGSSYAVLGIEKDWQKCVEEIAPADVSLKAQLNSALTRVRVDAEFTFPITRDNANYKVEYVLVHDSLTGSGSAWLQTNYYSGTAATDANLSEYCNGSSYMSGLYFNDVIVSTSRQTAGYHTLPTSVKEGEAVSDNFTFVLSKAVNTSGQSIIQDKKQLRVVVLLIDSKSGRIVNANQARVEFPTGITDVTLDGEDEDLSAPAYDLTGRPAADSYRGVVVKGGKKILRP